MRKIASRTATERSGHQARGRRGARTAKITASTIGVPTPISKLASARTLAATHAAPERQLARLVKRCAQSSASSVNRMQSWDDHQDTQVARIAIRPLVT